MFPRHVWKRIRSYDPHLHAISKGVKLRTRKVTEDEWIESYLDFFLRETQPEAFALAHSPNNSRLRREARRYLNQLLELMQLEWSLTASSTGVVSATRRDPFTAPIPYLQYNIPDAL
jgi:hypothetical protein